MHILNTERDEYIDFTKICIFLSVIAFWAVEMNFLHFQIF